MIFQAVNIEFAGKGASTLRVTVLQASQRLPRPEQQLRDLNVGTLSSASLLHSCGNGHGVQLEKGSERAAVACW